MPRFLLIFIVALALAGIAAWASGVEVRSAGPHVERTRSIDRFERVEVHGSTDVVVHSDGKAGKLKIAGGKNRVEDVRTRVENGTLLVEGEDSSATIDLGGDGVTVTVSTPSLAGVAVDGSGDVELPELDGGALELRVNGSADVSGAGRLDDLDAGVDGSGDLELGNVVARDASVDISGSGDAQLHAERTLEATVRGSGEVHYGGDPALTQHVDGSGSVSRG